MDPNCNEVTVERLEKVSAFLFLFFFFHFLTKGLVLLKTNTTFPLISVLPELYPQHVWLGNLKQGFLIASKDSSGLFCAQPAGIGYRKESDKQDQVYRHIRYWIMQIPTEFKLLWIVLALL